MNKNEFIGRLTKTLRNHHISDIEEIIAEYEEHFAFKLADGYSEEEIAAKLGNPEALAEQFVSSDMGSKPGGKKVITITGLIFADIFVGSFFFLLCCWVLVMGVLAIAFVSLGVCLIGGISINPLVPAMPYGCGAIFAIAFLALSVLSVVGTFYFAAYSRQLMRAYSRFHKNCIAAASGKPVLPSVAAYPQFSPGTNRKLRRIALLSLTIFAAAFIFAYIVSALTAGAVEFWHEWNWFVQ